MFNLKLEYVVLQLINGIFSVLSYLFVREHFHTHDDRTLAGFLIVGSVILAAGYVFFTNRIFYIWIKVLRERGETER